MKIKHIQISGFRGVPPINPPDVDIDLTDSTNGPKDLLLFGPNAYGKSSIADALEWFFKENVRGSTYFEEYCSQDNVHLNLGKPNYPQKAFIELVLVHNGTEYTVSKELDCEGKKSGENLTGIQAQLQQAQDEIIVLDHDQFRNFVSAANKEKWNTFSSLIGYEELDHFRAGLDSITTKSLTDFFTLETLRKDVIARERKWQLDLERAVQFFKCSESTLDGLKTHFTTLLEANMASLLLPVPEMSSIDETYWTKLLDHFKTSEDIVKAATRLSHLTTLKTQLEPFEKQWSGNLENLERHVRILDEKKAGFDKELLARFYQTGLQVMLEQKALPDQCPFCSTPYDWMTLRTFVEKQHSGLNFTGIQSEHQALLDVWSKVKNTMLNRQKDLKDSSLSNIQERYQAVSDYTSVDEALSLPGFNKDHIETWLQNARDLAQEMDGNRAVIEEEITQAETAANNPQAEIQQTVNDLRQYWQTILALDNAFQENNNLKNKLTIIEKVVDSLRNVAGNFRNELSDFSGRVAVLINNDVQKYYHELHPRDDVVPVLDVSISGTQRQVTLKCTYKGTPNRAAVTLLSESHRNSLGMAILLAFMKYKRQVGSPIEFCIFDDVTQSFDVEHRTNLLNLLENPNFPEICGQQIIFMTHDRTLADLVKRPGEQNLRDYWLRVDIRNWWLERMVLESERSLEPLNRAQSYIDQNDEIAAGIYVRRGLEQLYKTIISKTEMRVPYSDKPWNVAMEKYREYILEEITELWADNKGFIDPNDPLFQQLFTSQRILNLTVHDSQFLDNPMTLGDVQATMALVQQLKNRFSCQNCTKFYHTVRKSGANNPVCKGQGCNTLLT